MTSISNYPTLHEELLPSFQVLLSEEKDKLLGRRLKEAPGKLNFRYLEAFLRTSQPQSNHRGASQSLSASTMIGYHLYFKSPVFGRVGGSGMNEVSYITFSTDGEEVDMKRPSSNEHCIKMF